jgi:Uma2 family endonuclease
MAALPDLLGRGNYTREEVNRMEESGALVGRYELLEGHLIDKMGQNPPHARSLNRMYGWLLRVFGNVRLRNQQPIEVATGDRRRNDPQPDIAVVAEDKTEYDERHPRGDELTLIVEVADSSSRFDLSVKVGLYARAGVPEYWVMDISRRVLVTHREPEQGTYTHRVELSEHEYVSIGDTRALVSDLLPRT